MAYYQQVILQKQNTDRSGFEDVLTVGGIQVDQDFSAGTTNSESPALVGSFDITVQVRRTKKVVETYSDIVQFQLGDAKITYKVVAWVENIKKETMQILGERI